MSEERNFSFWRHQFPAIAWAGIIILLSSIPPRLFPTTTIYPLDKVFHVIIFFVFCLLLYRAVLNQGRFPALSRYGLLASFLIVVVYGILDEIFQSFIPGRTPDVADAIADAFGGLLATVYLFLQIKFRSIWEAKGV